MGAGVQRDGAEQTEAALAAFHRRFASLFGRQEVQEQSLRYLRGLLLPGEPTVRRKSAERVAAALGGVSGRALQRLLSTSPWPADAVVAALQRYVGLRLAHPDGIFAVGEIGFVKRGQASVGAARQSWGADGRVETCQLGVFLAYVSPLGRALVDARLFLPRAWIEDAARCRRAGVPPASAYLELHELALHLVQQARARGDLPARYVTAANGLASAPALRDGFHREGWHYLVEVPATAPVAVFGGPGAAGQRVRPSPPARGPRAIETLGDAVALTGWQEVALPDASGHAVPYRCAARSVASDAKRRLSHPCILVARTDRAGHDPHYYLTNAPLATPLLTIGRLCELAALAAPLFVPDGTPGLSDYQVRNWQGWHHHVALALLGGVFHLGLPPAHLS